VQLINVNRLAIQVVDVFNDGLFRHAAKDSQVGVGTRAKKTIRPQNVSWTM
jgi:hypothetical protein